MNTIAINTSSPIPTMRGNKTFNNAPSPSKFKLTDVDIASAATILSNRDNNSRLMESFFISFKTERESK
jgi:hypothetical protein